MYAIIRSHRRFETLASFTLRGAVEEIRRVRSERKSSSNDAPTNSPSRPEFKSVPSTTSLVSIGTLANEEKFFDGTEDKADDPVRMSEKARGKMRERPDSPIVEGDPGFPGMYRSKTGFVPTESCKLLLRILYRFNAYAHLQGLHLGENTYLWMLFSSCCRNFGPRYLHYAQWLLQVQIKQLWTS